MKRILFILTSLLMVTGLWADDVTFQAQAPKQVVLGRPFQLVYTLNQRSGEIQAPDFSHFDVLAGPHTGVSTQISIVNGHRTTVNSKSFTYTLMAQQVGEYTLQPATVQLNGQQYSSNGVRIQVLPADQPQQQSQQSQSSQSSSQQASSSNAGGDNLFIRTIVSKTQVHEQEAILLQYKLYFAGVDVAQFTNNTHLPEFTGFLKQELEQGELQAELEHYNGRNYQTAVLYRTLLYPQHSGDIVIDPATFEAVLRVQTRAQVRSIFDDFFGTYTNVTRTLRAPSATIHVAALPSGKPASFSGGVGRFNLQQSISETDVQQNEAITIRLDIQGNGNMKLLKTPAVDWPEGFELYDPKVTNNFKTTAQGVTGTKSIEYLAIPRSAGNYTIPAVQFSYFDIEQGAYRTLSTPEYHVNVRRAPGSEQASDAAPSTYVAKEDIRSLGTDIRYIHTAELTPGRANNGLAYGSALAWTLVLLPLLITIVTLVLLRKRIRDNADVTRMRYKRANKVAQRRLKQAAQLLRAGKQADFYQEIERAAYSYLSDRLSIPTADLHKDNITALLQQHQVPEALIRQTMQVLSTAEFARYAPSSDQQMDQLYNDTTNLINQLEEQSL